MTIAPYATDGKPLLRTADPSDHLIAQWFFAALEAP